MSEANPSASINDDDYCHEIAQRAVARAALYLGLSDTAEVECLEVLASCLIAYLERVGLSMATSVQASGRSSVHCNVLDAMNAVELCTSAAVQRVHTTTTADTEAAASDAASHDIADDVMQQRSWKGLAAFLFGPQWDVDDADQRLAQPAQAAARAGGGKVGPSSTATVGWRAPYPDQLAAFPKSLEPPQPPSLLQATMESASEQYHEAEQALESIPNAIFGWSRTTTEETAAKAGSKRKALDMPDEPKTKKARTERGIKTTTTTEDEDHPPYLPTFYPPFPKPGDALGRVVLDEGTPSAAEPKEEPLIRRQGPAPLPSSVDAATAPATVRSALVQLEHNEPQVDHVFGAIAQPVFAVPAGRSQAEAATTAPSIVPLGRASGNVVSRILEGSMEGGMP